MGCSWYNGSMRIKEGEYLHMTLGVLFDFNGTLLQDTSEQEIAWRTFAREVARREVSAEEFRTKVHGSHNRKVLPFLMDRTLSDEEMQEFSEKKEAIYRDICLANIANFHLIKGAPAFFDLLKEKGVPMTIATASPKSNVDFYFEHLGLAKWFDFSKVVFDDGTIRSKPEPDSYLQAADRIGVPVTACIVFEDSLAGIASGVNADAKKVIAVATDGNNEELAKIGCVAKVVADFTQLAFEDLL